MQLRQPLAGRSARVTVVPRSSSAQLVAAWKHALVSVDIEEIPGGATTIWIHPAFDSDADPQQRVPGGAHILTPAERERLVEAGASTR